MNSVRSVPRAPRFRFAHLVAPCVALFALHVGAMAQESIAPAVQNASSALAHVSVMFQTSTGAFVRVERPSSGFVVDPRGLLVTNEHLVKEIATGEGSAGPESGAEYWLQVVLAGSRPVGAKVLARDVRLDLALLQLELEPGELIASIELDPGATTLPGTEAFVLGRPQGGQHFALAGTVATPHGEFKLRAALLQPDEAWITDAAILEDVDGGPFVDRRGLALGIVNTAQRTAFDPKADEEMFRNPLEYAIAVRASSIRRAFGEHLSAPAGESAPRGVEELAVGLVRAHASAVVSVWAGDDASRPQHSAPNDPNAERPQKGLGSGVVVDPSGLVLTTSDIIEAATEVSVRLLDGTLLRARVVRSLPGSRIALLQIALPEGVRLPSIPLGSSDASLAGESVVVVGNPYGHTPSVSTGVLAALEAEERLRIGAWVHDGHKGGALLDSTGRLIGLPVADIFEGAERKRGESYLGVALPIDRVRTWLAEDLAGENRAPGLSTAPVAGEAELAARRNTVTSIVAGTLDSLLNVLVSAEARKSGGFDPFDTPGELRPLGQGSGVVIDASGLAISNWHVVAETLAEDGTQRADHTVSVTLPSGRSYSARVLAASRDDDLALLQLQLPEGETVKPVPLGATKSMRRGDVVVAIGNPYGKANTVTVGIVAAKDQNANISGRLHIYENMLQTDAAINPGNSGGALLDLEGQLIGINSAGRAGAGLAIPVERVREVFGQKLMATMGPFLGFAVQDTSKGVEITAVEALGPAATAGVAKGDLVRSIDGRAITSAVEFGNVLLAPRTTPMMRLEVLRGTETKTFEVISTSHTAWRVFRQTGIEVIEVEYAQEAERVRDASLALHRAYTGLVDAEPSRLMDGALRVVRIVPRESMALDIQPGDLLLGASAISRTVDTEHARLVRFENLRVLREFLDPIAAERGSTVQCWLLRGDKVHTVRVPLTRVR